MGVLLFCVCQADSLQGAVNDTNFQVTSFEIDAPFDNPPC